MTLLMCTVATVLAVIFAAGWLLLISSLVLVSSGVVAGLPIIAGATIRQRLAPSVTRAAEEGILCVEGLAGEARLAKRLRSGLTRVLAFASPATRPRACACVKKVDAGYVGVMRVFNAKGHYLLRVTGDTVAAIGTQFVNNLDAFTDRFPAKIGVPRAKCDECDQSLCPLRLFKQQRAQMVPA